MSLKKYLLASIIVLAVLATGSLVWLYDRTPSEPEVRYNTTQPTPRKKSAFVKKSKNHTHDHSHDTVQHTPAPKVAPSNNYDWRDDKPLDSLLSKTDPWRKKENVKNTTESANGEVYPPKNWDLTEDLELRAKYLYDILLKQFGDKPEVHTIGKYEHRAAKGIVPTLDEYIIYLEAHLSLWPNKTTRETLEEVLKMKDEGKNIIFVGWDE
ncbi:MAG: hypothetical protein OXI67_06590 [Candidatus Poribacteria bacterium]|nr:hypothetical protein [Candidatus Poribacteria bacterium]